MKFKDNMPIYLQIKDYLFHQIAIGQLSPGAKIPSVRELALELSVNTNTVQRALSSLVSDGVIVSIRGKGNFVVEDSELMTKTKVNLVKKYLDEMYQNLHSLNLSDEEIAIYVKYYLEEKNAK